MGMRVPVVVAAIAFVVAVELASLSVATQTMVTLAIDHTRRAIWRVDYSGRQPILKKQTSIFFHLITWLRQRGAYHPAYHAL